MLIKIPFYVQGINECGPVALKMIFEYFGENYDLEKIKKSVESETSGITFTIGLAKTSAELGFPTEFYSIKIEFNPENFELEYYKKLTDGVENVKHKSEKLYSDCLKYGVKLEERSISLSEILSKISEDCIPVVLLDWSKVNKSKNFIGHFVPIVGYDDKNIYVHQQGPKDPTPNYAIKKDLFEIARKAVGTDEDVLFIHRKKS